MRKYLVVLITVIIFLSGCCSGPRLNVKKFETISSQEKDKLNTATEYIVKHLQEGKAPEIYSEEHISTQMRSIPNMEKMYNDIVVCIESYLGKIESYDLSKKMITKSSTKVKNDRINVYLVKQPVQYTQQPITLKLQFVEQDEKMKLLRIDWYTENIFKNPPEYMMCLGNKKK